MVYCNSYENTPVYHAYSCPSAPINPFDNSYANRSKVAKALIGITSPDKQPLILGKSQTSSMGSSGSTSPSSSNYSSGSMSTRTAGSSPF